MLSSDDSTMQRSLDKTCDLFANNGYPANVLTSVRQQVTREARNMDMRGRAGLSEGEGRGAGRRVKRSFGRTNRQSGGVLLLPYVSETVLCKAKRAAKKSGLNVNVASYTPNTLKRNLVHSSFSDPPCPSGKRTCNTCKKLKNGRCTDKNVVYELSCTLCGDTYIGESKRPLRLRFNEHVRCAANETQYTPIGDHFASCHTGLPRADKLADPPLEVRILRKTRDHPDRKIAESLCIRDRKPRLNENLSSWRTIS